MYKNDLFISESKIFCLYTLKNIFESTRSSDENSWKTSCFLLFVSSFERYQKRLQEKSNYDFIKVKSAYTSTLGSRPCEYDNNCKFKFTLLITARK